ncbi:MAG: hypothetical protein M3Z25_06585 [Actinomycetota bacterium]|nr:hypothetical protein [Actinomycetota bacterium]MDQ2788366.1 hypothetical protein [Actinomycetota bacterium]
MNNLAGDLADAGRRVEGLAATQEAVQLRRELVESNRDAYLPDLAASVNNLANRFAEVGRRAEWLAAAQEAQLYQELAPEHPRHPRPFVTPSRRTLPTAGRRPAAADPDLGAPGTPD